MRLEDIRQLKTIARGRLETLAVEGEVGAEARAVARDDVLADFRSESPRWFSLGIGTTERRGDFQLAIRIRTEKPIPGIEETVTKALSENFGSDDLNIQHTGPVRAISRRSAGALANGQLEIGSSVSLVDKRGGTLGFFARSLDTGREGFVSANHVIGDQDRAEPAMPVVHPASGAANSDPIGVFSHLVPLGGEGDKRVDCAFAELAPNVAVDRRRLPNGQRLDPQAATFRESRSVRKFGFRTRETFGRVTAFEQDNVKVVTYGSHLGIVTFDDQIEVESTTLGFGFSNAGDSGSLVYNENLRAVGLLFASSLQGGRNNRGLSYVNRIDFVLDALRVELST